MSQSSHWFQKLISKPIIKDPYSRTAWILGRFTRLVKANKKCPQCDNQEVTMDYTQSDILAQCYKCGRVFDIRD